jgi:hypothetical protein
LFFISFSIDYQNDTRKKTVYLGFLKNLLSDIGVKYEKIEQTGLEETDPLKLFSSPSILKDGKMIFAQKIDSTKGGCTLNLPDKFHLAKKLKK